MTADCVEVPKSYRTIGLGICSRRGSRISLPQVVLVGVGVVADPASDDTRKMIHQARRFHFKTQHPFVFCQTISNVGIFHQSVRGRDESIVHRRVVLVRVAHRPLDDPASPANLHAWPVGVSVEEGRLEEDVSGRVRVLVPPQATIVAHHLIHSLCDLMALSFV